MRTFAIGIPTLNRLDLLHRALEFYLTGMPDVHIYIVDNGGQFPAYLTDKDAGIMHSYGENVTIFSENRLSVAESWNILANEIFKNHDYALILNDDVIFQSSADDVEEFIQNNDFDFAKCETDFSTSVFLLPKKTFKDTGDFDRLFYPAYFEDNDYARRMDLLGKKTMYAKVLNPVLMGVSSTLEKDPSLHLYFNDNKDRYFRKWGGAPHHEIFTKPYNETTKAKKKILWIGEFRINTGFGRVSESLLKYLALEYEITVVDIYRTLEGGYTVRDFVNASGSSVGVVGKMNYYDTWAVERVKSICENFDAVFMIQDVWNINVVLNALKESGKKVPPVVMYFPIDAGPHDPEWYENMDMVKYAVTYTEYAKREVLAALGDKGQEKVIVIPHGIDGDRFKKIDKTKAEIRKEIFGNDDYDTAFIFLNANRNQNRKRLELTMEAFSIFVKKYDPDRACLYMHCGNTDDSHVDVLKLAKRLGISGRLIMTTTNRGLPNSSDTELNRMYNACDVGVNTSMGEGWGLPNTEHAKIGAPQLVTNHSANTELYLGVSPLVKASAPFLFNQSMTIGWLTDVEDLAEKMNLLYSNQDVYDKYSKACYDKFNSKEYTWEYIAKLWQDVFDSI